MLNSFAARIVGSSTQAGVECEKASFLSISKNVSRTRFEASHLFTTSHAHFNSQENYGTDEEERQGRVDARRGRSSSFFLLTPTSTSPEASKKNPTSPLFLRALAWSISPLSAMRPSRVFMSLLTLKEMRRYGRKWCQFRPLKGRSLPLVLLLFRHRQLSPSLSIAALRRKRLLAKKTLNVHSLTLSPPTLSLSLSRNPFQSNSRQDEILRRAVSHHGGRCWKQIGEDPAGREQGANSRREQIHFRKASGHRFTRTLARFRPAAAEKPRSYT